jgi:hypothetical protein
MTHSRQRNENKITGSTVVNSPVIAGSQATVSVGREAGELDPRLMVALTDLHNRLQDVEATLDRRDDAARENLALAGSRLGALQEELALPAAQRDPGRINRFMTRLRESVVGLTALTASVDTLWETIENVIH